MKNYESLEFLNKISGYGMMNFVFSFIKCNLYWRSLKKQSYHLRNILYAKLIQIFPFLPPGRHVLVLTNRCNLKCSHCFQNHQKLSHAMDIADWFKVVDQLPSKSYITITGGEPLLFKGFYELFERIANKHYCNIITNGILLNRRNIEFFLKKKKFRVLGVSIDGQSDMAYRIRGVDNKTFEILIDSLKHFVQLKNEIKSSSILNIKTVILDENAEELYDFHRFIAEEIGADTHDLYFLKGSPIQHADVSYTLQDCFKPINPPKYIKKSIIIDQLKKIFIYDKRHNLKTFLHPKIPLEKVNLLLEDQFNQYDYQKCILPWSSLHINYNGEVYPCLSVPIGSVKRYSLREIYKSDTYRLFLNEIRKNRVLPACVRCGWLKLSKKIN